MKISKKMKKTPKDVIILHKCTKAKLNQMHITVYLFGRIRVMFLCAFYQASQAW